MVTRVVFHDLMLRQEVFLQYWYDVLCVFTMPNSYAPVMFTYATIFSIYLY